MELGPTYIDVVIDGEDRTFDLTDVPTLSIGRSPQSTVVLADDANVSRKHALVQREASGDYYLSDLGSRNGTTRNGLPVTAPVPLRDGDSFTIGSHRFVFHQTTVRAAEEDEYQDPTDVLVVERMITILVLDIRNYTVLARELGEARVTEVMNRLFHESGQLLKRQGSWAQKYIGDAVMAFWVHDGERGTPREMVLLLQSLVQLTAVIAKLNDELELPRKLAFGAGVNSGLAVTGNMGSAGLTDHTAMGDAVNKAFRLETATKEVGREILLGKSTYDLIDLPENLRAHVTTHTVHLKGYDAPEEVYGLALADLPRLVEALGG
ncbi:MAG TPA: adenylate/guanylate cyclase domain-containing protein [Longimicrobiales bacterium]|nr:adenylate/guanylate cyclase domain-containing protein [Longimicrobiales bacterium]